MSDSLKPGDLVASKFRIERIVGKGGMGYVVAATNIQLDQRVALKFLAAGIDDPLVVERFSHEARAAVKLRSEHVARVYDVGTDPLRGPFMVMELLDGSSLADVLAKSGRLQVQRAAEYVIDACEGVSEAHARGVIHQDLKPANLFVTTGNDGKSTIKVLDFGIAKMIRTSDAPEQATTSGVLGSPHYLAPEQLRASTTVDRTADVWALGCVLFELVTGEKAFKGERIHELVAKIIEGKRTAVPLGLDVPSGLFAVVDRCLQTSPSQRFTSTAELAVALLPFARRRAHSAVSRAVARVRDAGIDPHLQMPSSMPPRPSDGFIDVASARTLRAPPVPVIDSPPDSAIPPSSPSPLPASLPARGRKAVPIAVSGLVVVALLVTGVVGVWRLRAAPSAGGAAPSAGPLAPTAASTITATATATATVETPIEPEPAPSASPDATPTPAIAVTAAKPSRTPRPAASDAGKSVKPAASADFDIERRR